MPCGSASRRKKLPRLYASANSCSRTWLVPRLVVVAVYAQREKVVDALSRAFDGPEWLFAAMYSNCCGVEQEIEQRRDDLEEEMTMLEERQTQVLPEKD